MTQRGQSLVGVRRIERRMRSTIFIPMAVLLLLFVGVGSAGAATPPARPDIVSVTADGATAVTVKWQDTSNNEAGFWIYVNNAYSPPNRTANTTSTQVTGLSPATRYCFKVEAFSADSAGAAGSGQSGELCATTTSNNAGAAPSPPPSGQSATSVPGGLRLTWYDNSLNETAWLVHDGSSPQRSFTVNGSTVGWRSFDWTGMSPGQYACLHVRGYNQRGAGEWPKNPYWACGTASGVGPSAPVDPAVKPHFSRALIIDFTDTATNETDFEVFNGSETRRTGQRRTGTGAFSYLWDGLAPNTYMCFKVRAVNQYGVSAYAPASTWACGTTRGY